MLQLRKEVKAFNEMEECFDEKNSIYYVNSNYYFGIGDICVD